MHGVWFNDIHSYNDLGLVLSSKKITLPAPKISTVDVPGANGSIDMTTVLTDGEVKYSNRNLTFNFTLTCPFDERETQKSKVANAIHGRQFKVKLDTDPEYYYDGRCSISDFTDDKRTGKMTVGVDAKPYKYKVEETIVTSSVNGNTTLILHNEQMRVVPTISVNAEIECIFEGTRHALNSGDNMILDLCLKKGDNVIEFVGTADVVIKYREGCL